MLVSLLEQSVYMIYFTSYDCSNVGLVVFQVDGTQIYKKTDNI